MQTAILLLLGLVLGVLFIVLARLRPRVERLILAVGLVVATLFYLGSAATGRAPASWLGIELLGVAAFGLVAWLGMRGSAWWLVVGWALHPVWDVGLHLVGAGSAFAPAWYAVNCISFDLLVAAYVAWRFGGAPAARRAG